jgi:Uma2 family endonuclease
MAIGSQISVAEYLKTVFRPDCDYVDGLVEARNFGELDHGLTQARLAHFFLSRSKQAGFLAATELRIRVKANRFRVPDVTVMLGKPGEQVLTRPPLLCIEILSPEDRPGRVNARIQEYLDFGVSSVWLINPAERRVFIHRKRGVEEVHDVVKLDGTSIEVPFSEIFD